MASCLNFANARLTVVIQRPTNEELIRVFEFIKLFNNNPNDYNIPINYFPDFVNIKESSSEKEEKNKEPPSEKEEKNEKCEKFEKTLPIVVDATKVEIPECMSFDDLANWMVKVFSKNKVDTNVNNAKTIKSFFVNHLKIHSFEFRQLQKTKNILELLKDRTDVSAKSILSAISKCFQLYNLITPEEYITRMKELTENIEKEMKKRILNEKEEKNMINDEEIKNLFDKYKNATDLEGKQNYLLLLLYTKCEPLRLDYAEMLVGAKMPSETENCYELSTGNIYLRKYKTAKKYGNKVIKLPEDVQEFIKEFLLWRREHNIYSDYLLINNKTHTPMNRVNLNKQLTKLFGKSVGVNILRKYFVSTNINADDLEKQEEIANKMCHSTAVQKSVYCKKIKNKF